MRLAQGQSLATLDKQRQLSAIFCMNLNIVRCACPTEEYHHIDLNAGSGWNDAFDVPGSPMVFMKVAEQYLDRWKAYFFERDSASAARLRETIGDDPRCEVIEGDNCNFLALARKRIPKRALGSVLGDPNGYFYRNQRNGNGVPVAQLTEFFEEYRRMDLIANINMRQYDLQRGAQKAALAAATYSEHFHRLQDFPAVFNKKDGLITLGASNGHSTFVRIILRNLRTDGYRKWGWFPWDSRQARRIFDFYDGDRNGYKKLQMVMDL